MPPLRSLVFLALVSAGVAQSQFSDGRKRHLPLSPHQQIYSATAVDLDGDGASELLAWWRTSHWCLGVLGNDGHGVFAHRQTIVNASSGVGTVTADVDGDRDQDLIVSTGLTLQIYVNQRGQLVSGKTFSSYPRTAVMADFDGDGDVDALVTRSTAPWIQLYLNDGKGNFADASARLPQVAVLLYAPVACDIDADGDLDLAGFGPPNSALLLQNDGNAKFLDITNTHLPRLPSNALVTRSFDADGDRDLDLWVGTSYGADYLLLNDGKGKFVDGSNGRIPRDTTYSGETHVRDVDSDGDSDILVGGTSMRVLRNNGRGVFSNVTPQVLPTPSLPRRFHAAFDADRDGDVDLFATSNTGIGHELLFNDGNGKFATSRRIWTNIYGPPLDFEVADVDDDADGDVIITGQPLALMINDGRGSLSDATKARLPSLPATPTASVEAGDVDGDGDVDLVTAGNPAYLLINDGKGHFSDRRSQMPVPSISWNAVSMADVDADRDLDLLFAGGTTMALFINDGKGQFVDKTQGRLPPAPNLRSAWIGSGDLDGDGDVDFAVAGWYGRTLLRNDGKGVFAAVRWTAIQRAGYLDFADIDGDGDQDLLSGDRGLGPKLWLSEKGGLTDVSTKRTPNNAYQPFGAAFGDIDEDGDPDIIVAARYGLIVWLNDGRGVFRDATGSRTVDVRIDGGRALLADMDGDGDLDVVNANTMHLGANVIFNRLRHIDAPWMLRAGQPYQLSLYSRPSEPTGRDVAVTLIGTKAARIPLGPWGTLGVDPATAIALPALALPTGHVALRFALRNDPSLHGALIRTQAFIVDPSSGARFTNVHAEKIW